MSGSQVISGSLTVVTGSGIEFQVTNTGVRIGNVITDTHNVTGSLNVSGSIATTGTITAQTLVVQTVSSSVIYSSGSNIFGNNIANTQTLTGSVNVTGSLAVVTNGTEFQVTSTGVNLGNALTDSHVISGSLRVNPNGLFVSSSGFVGIGTTSPSTVLHVSGSSSRVALITTSGALSSGFYDGFQMLATNQTGGGLSLNIGKAESTNDLAKMVYFHVANGSTSNRLGFGFYANDNLFNILANGNVGIGTSSPVQPLQLGQVSVISQDANSMYVGANFGTSTGGNYIKSQFANQIHFDSALGDMNFKVAGSGTAGNAISYTTAMKITSAGNIQIDSGQLNTPKSLYFQANSNTGGNLGSIDWYNVQWDGAIRAQIKGETDTALANGRLVFSTGGGGVTERMRITSGGVVYINATSNPTPGNAVPQLGIVGAAGTDAVNIKHDQNGNNTLNIWQIGTTSHNAIAFYKGDTQANRGLITVTTSGTTYNSVSDYRLKENIVPLENGLDRVLQLKPSKFNWIETGEETEGFIAHELQEYFPDAVTGEKDAIYSSTGNIKPQSVDYGRITPLLVKAIQELKVQNDDLQSQINELKAQ